MRRRTALLALSALSSAAGGCFVAYPSVARSPGVPVPAADGVVAVVAHAKRVQHGTAPVPEERHTLRRVELTGGRVEPQFGPYLFRSTGLMFGSIHDAYLLTKLYRPGYKTVILDARDEGPPAVVWQPATGPDEQEEAVRRLVYHARPGFSGRSFEPDLPPGSADPRHREVLLLAAAEFERVAALYPGGSEGAARCRSTADVLRRRAAE